MKVHIRSWINKDKQSVYKVSHFTSTYYFILFCSLFIKSPIFIIYASSKRIFKELQAFHQGHFFMHEKGEIRQILINNHLRSFFAYFNTVYFLSKLRILSVFSFLYLGTACWSYIYGLVSSILEPKSFFLIQGSKSAMLI